MSVRVAIAITLLADLAVLVSMLWQTWVMWQNNQEICQKMAEVGLRCYGT